MSLWSYKIHWAVQDSILFDILTEGFIVKLTFSQKNLLYQSGLFWFYSLFPFHQLIHLHDRCPHACCREPRGALQLNATCGVSLLFEPVVQSSPSALLMTALTADPAWYSTHTEAKGALKTQSPLRSTHSVPFLFPKRLLI